MTPDVQAARADLFAALDLTIRLARAFSARGRALGAVEVLLRTAVEVPGALDAAMAALDVSGADAAAQVLLALTPEETHADVHD